MAALNAPSWGWEASCGLTSGRSPLLDCPVTASTSGRRPQHRPRHGAFQRRLAGGTPPRLPLQDACSRRRDRPDADSRSVQRHHDLVHPLHRPQPHGAAIPAQHRIPDYDVPSIDHNGRHSVDYIEGQDTMAWVTQGKATDPDGGAHRQADSDIVASDGSTVSRWPRCAKAATPSACPIRARSVGHLGGLAVPAGAAPFVPTCDVRPDDAECRNVLDRASEGQGRSGSRAGGWRGRWVPARRPLATVARISRPVRPTWRAAAVSSWRTVSSSR